MSESVQVEAQATPVQTTSQERSALVNETQLATLMARGRDVFSFLRILPGSTYEGAGDESLGTPTAPTMNGIRYWYIGVNLDGVVSSTRGVGVTENPLNLDAVAEVKVLGGNYSAEHGKVSGTIINIVTKSGTQDFHGSGYYYKRHEMWNATNFFVNRNGLQKPRYRYSTVGYNIGGPIYIPGKFNSDKSKLFFFFSQEFQPNQRPGGVRTYTVPTQQERVGDFSQSIDQNDAKWIVRDPLTGQPFPLNVLPASRILPDMQKILNIFPNPNFFNRQISLGNYNYVISDTIKNPIHQEVMRLDYNPSPKLRAFFRGMDMSVVTEGRSVGNFNAGWKDGVHAYNTRNPNIGLNLTFIPNARIVNELSVGAGFWFETNTFVEGALDGFRRDKLGIQFGQLHPEINPLNLIPAISFGNIPGAAALSWDGRWPMDNAVTALSISDGLSVVRSSHMMKFGVYLEDSQYEQRHQAGLGGGFAGNLAFNGRNPNNPFDAGYAYAGALLGYFDSYTESTARPTYWGLNKVFEFYAQDNWRLSRKLTLDIGLRFTADLPASLKRNEGAAFIFGRYDRRNVPPMFFPVRNAQGQRLMRNPVTGELFPEVYFGRFVPGIGDPAPGSLLASSPEFPGFYASQGVLMAPRFGFAYDVFGKGKTAVRGGFGIFNNMRSFQGLIGDNTFNPPTIFYPVQFYGNVQTFRTGGTLLTPSNIQTIQEHDSHLPSSYNISFGIQQDIGFQTVVDLAYVSTLGRHQTRTRQLNLVPYGARFLPENQDPTTGTPLPDNYFRPYPGIGNMPYLEWAENTNYQSLQVQFNRRFRKGLQFGGAYTWSKTLDYANEGGTIPTYLSPRWNYGPGTSDRRHRLVVNWLWELPKASRAWNNPVSRWVFDNWKFSGIAMFVSGSPRSVSFSTVDNQDITGGGDGGRIVLTGNPVLQKGDRTFDSFFNTSVFARPPLNSIGNASRAPVYGPGINNWDLAFFKDFPIENRVTFQFRWEMYNAFNHTQWSGVDTAARFAVNGNQINGNFGKITSTRDPRVMQGALRIIF